MGLIVLTVFGFDVRPLSMVKRVMLVHWFTTDDALEYMNVMRQQSQRCAF